MKSNSPNGDETKALWKKARTSGMSRREFMLLLTGAGAAAALDACAAKIAPTEPKASTPSAPTPATPTQPVPAPMIPPSVPTTISPTPPTPAPPLSPTPTPPPEPKPGMAPEAPVKSVQSVPATSACAITSPPPSMEGINTHTELYGTGADPSIITLGPKVGGHPGWPPYEHKPGMGFEAYEGGSPVLAPFDMVLVGFRDTSTSSQIGPGGTSAHSDDVKLFFESASTDWPGVYMTVYHLLTSPLLTGHTQSASNDLLAPPAQGFQLFWEANYTLSPTGNAASYGALIGYKVKRGELIGFAGTVPAPDGVGTHSFADFYFDVPDASVNRNITKGDIHLHLVQPGSFFYWKSYSPDANFPNGVLAYPFECDGYQLPIERRDVNFKYTPKK